MPFDYESFMQGVMTGLKLGRIPKERTPPVPSGKYILTESGDHVILEYETVSETTTIRFNQWYTDYEHGTVKVVDGYNPSFDGAYFFWCYLEQSDGTFAKTFVVYSDSSAPAQIDWIGTNDQRLWRWNIYGSYARAGNYYYNYSDMVGDFTPVDSLLPYLTTAELYNLITNIGPTPLITDGG